MTNRSKAIAVLEQIQNLGKIKTPAHGNFKSLETLLAFDRKLTHEMAVEMAKHVGGYDSAVSILSFKPESKIKSYFFDRLSILTVLDPLPPGGASSDVIEVYQDGSYWITDVGHPGNHVWWYFDELEPAIAFACSAADHINGADDPDWALLNIIHGTWQT